MGYHCLSQAAGNFGQYLYDLVPLNQFQLLYTLVLNDSSYELCIYTFTCDAPARALLKGIVQHTGYCAFERCTIKGTSIRDRIAYDRTEKSTLTPNDTGVSMGCAEKDEIGKSHQLAPSPIKR